MTYRNNQLPAGLLLDRWLEEAPGAETFFASDTDTARKTLEELRLTNRSALGAVLARFGGILCAGGNLRLLGSENPVCASLREINGLKNGRPATLPGLLAVADDANGGIFGINCGLLPGEDMGMVLYLPSSSLCWEPLMIGYADFLCWALHITPSALHDGGWRCCIGDFPSLPDADTILKGKLAMYCSLPELEDDDGQ